MKNGFYFQGLTGEGLYIYNYVCGPVLFDALIKFMNQEFLGPNSYNSGTSVMALCTFLGIRKSFPTTWKSKVYCNMKY